MMFIIALHAVLSLNNICAFVKTALTATAPGRKTRSTTVDPKDLSKVETQHCHITVHALKEAILGQVHQIVPRRHQLLLTQLAYNSPETLVANNQRHVMTESTSCCNAVAGLLRQHGMLHRQIPEDLLRGIKIDVGTLQQNGILILGVEQFQLDGDITPPGPDEEPSYFKRFHLVVDFHLLMDAGILIPGFEQCQLGEDTAPPDPHEEPACAKYRRANRSLRIDIEKLNNYDFAVKHRAVPLEPIAGSIDIRKQIALSQACINSGKPFDLQPEEEPGAPDYITHHMFEKTYCWKEWFQYQQQDPEGFEWRLAQNPELEKNILVQHQAAEKYRANYPEDFARFFPELATEHDLLTNKDSLNELDSAPVSTSPSPTMTAPPLPKDSTPEPPDWLNPKPNNRRASNDSGYSSGDDLSKDGVWNDPATIHVVINSKKRWSNLLGVNDFLAHESCLNLEEYMGKKAAAQRPSRLLPTEVGLPLLTTMSWRISDHQRMIGICTARCHSGSEVRPKRC